MPVRIAKPEDFDLVFSMAMKFANSLTLKSKPDELKIKGMVHHFLNDVKCVVFLYDDKGFLAATVQPFMLNTDLTATEVAWWVEPDYRGKLAGKELVRLFELWAEEVGVKLITMACYDDGVGKFYEKQGYKLYERAYIKEI